MEGTSYSSNCADKEGPVSKCKSNLSLSGGDFPYEDGADWTDTTSSEDSTSEASFCYFLSPVQESWGTECGRMPTETPEEIPDDSEQLGELPIVQVLDVYLGSHYEGSLATSDLCGDDQRKDKDPQERINHTFWKLEGLMTHLQAYREDLKDDEDDASVLSDSTLDDHLEPFTSALSCRYLIICREHYDFEDFPDWKVQELEDIRPSEEISPRQEEQLVKMTSLETTTEDTLSVSSGQSTEGDTHSHSETTSCLNIGSIVRWFRKRVFSSQHRGKSLDVAHKDARLQESKKQHFLRGKRIQPQ